MSRLPTTLDAQLQGTLGDWGDLVRAWRASEPGRALAKALDARLAQGAVVFPSAALRAFELTPRAATRVVILGQDPYHGPGQAEGLAFSVAPGQRLPPSLRNIVRELSREFGGPQPTSGSLESWARQGVLLLNTTLTVERGQPASHAGWGWQALTDAVIMALAADARPKVFMLWGAHAQAHAATIEAHGPRHLTLKCAHPSPLSATRGPTPFAGCGHFGVCNRFLESQGQGTVDWALA